MSTFPFNSGSLVSGIVPGEAVRIEHAAAIGSNWNVIYKRNGAVDSVILSPSQIAVLELAASPYSFDAPYGDYWAALEAMRISKGYLFDPMGAIHTSAVDPLPHQITAVYDEMLTRNPLRYLLADDPGAGKTIMAGLLIKELIARGSLERCLIVAPGSLTLQWQEELFEKFGLTFGVYGKAAQDAAVTGNWFTENRYAVASVDKLARNDDDQMRACAEHWDLVIVDEAHKMSARYEGYSIHETLRYKLGKRLSESAYHFLLMTATPHNGNPSQFQLFMSLLDGDRFVGKPREDGVHMADPADMMRRMIKEQLVTMSGDALFPPRFARSIGYDLSPDEAALYDAVTQYVRTEFNRAKNLDGKKRSNIGFALTSLQRRLASSPEAIYMSLRRRLVRFEEELKEMELHKAGMGSKYKFKPILDVDLDDDDLEMMDEEFVAHEEEAITSATAAQTAEELRAEIATLRSLVLLAEHLRASNEDSKWKELSAILQDDDLFFDEHGHRQKLVLFTEHKDTLNYLHAKIGNIVGTDAIVLVHGGVGREERRNHEERFREDKSCVVFLATDAAGEGINLQRAHLVVNYDLPWNPNRLEQRFGRVHRIGQHFACWMFNMVAHQTREGAVYQRLLTKLEAEKQALDGRVFDIVGQLFENRPLRDLLMEAIVADDVDWEAGRDEYLEQIDELADPERINALLAESALVPSMMDATKLREIARDMERANLKRLAPHYLADFFRRAFEMAGGIMREKEKDRFELKSVPLDLREIDRQTGTSSIVQKSYERVTFDPSRVRVNQLDATLLAPGHPLFDALARWCRRRLGPTLSQGAVLVDPKSSSDEPYFLVTLHHRITGSGAMIDSLRVHSERLLFLRVSPDGVATPAGDAPMGDLLMATDDAAEIAASWGEEHAFGGTIENVVLAEAQSSLQSEHFEVQQAERHTWANRMSEAVRVRLQAEITHWDDMYVELSEAVAQGKKTKISPAGALRRKDELKERLARRTTEIERQRHLQSLPVEIVSVALVVPEHMIFREGGELVQTTAAGRKAVEEAAVRAVMTIERSLGYEPEDVGAQKIGYDVDSTHPDTGERRFIEVKGRRAGGATLTLTKNEINYSRNDPEKYIWALARVDGDDVDVRYLRHLFDGIKDDAVNKTYPFNNYWEKAEAPV
jgi:superfamily II DNA or RNA helicase